MSACKSCFGSGGVFSNSICNTCKGTGVKPEEKAFDIGEHEWFDGDIISVSDCETSLELDLSDAVSSCLFLTREDAIALAKHFKLTAEDLS